MGGNVKSFTLLLPVSIFDPFFLLLKDCVKSVKASATLPYDEGIEYEKTLMRKLLLSGQSAAQRYAFFAERAVTRVCKS